MNICCNCGAPAGDVVVMALVWGEEKPFHYCDPCADKKPCRCPSEFCRIDQDNCPELCPELRQNEICGYR
jgi:hypothetical protein